MAGGLHEQDPKAFELLAGHDVKMSMEHYQILTDSRKEKAVGKFLEIMDTDSASKTTTPFTTPLQHQIQHCNRLQGLDDIVTETGKPLENKDICKKKETLAIPCEGTVYRRWEYSNDAKTPRNQGTFDNCENTSTGFGTDQNYFGQIIDLFDLLDSTEQVELLNVLSSRSKHQEAGIV